MITALRKYRGALVGALALALCAACGSAFASDAVLDLSDVHIDSIDYLLEKLPELKNLKEVQLGSPELTFDELRTLRAAFPHVTFHWTMEHADLQLSSEDTFIDLGKWQVRKDNLADFLAVLDCMPKLEKVDMYETNLRGKNRIDIDYLAERYPNIRFGWTLRVGDHTVRTDATAFSTLHKSSPKPTHQSKDFVHLKYCMDMLALDIGHNTVTDITFLEKMPQLKVLILAVNRIQDLSPLAKLTELEYLELFTNRIRNISPLANLTKLKDLNISYNSVRDYSPLLNLPNLERLWLYNSYTDPYKPLPADQMEALLAAHPDCQINTKSQPTAGGWREHPRYFVIWEIFNRGKYIPFEDN